MAANLREIVVSTVSNVLALPKSVTIGDIEVQTSIEEIHNDTLQVTEHPVESGASITDHSFKKPAEVMLRCGWSNSSLKALFEIVTGFFSGGTISDKTYIGGIYTQLLKLQESRELFTITTTLRNYENMLMTGLRVTRDEKTASILMVEASCRQVIIVSTQSATLPPKSAQANPKSTAEVEDGGAKQLTPYSGPR